MNKSGPIAYLLYRRGLEHGLFLFRNKRRQDSIKGVDLENENK